MNPLSSFLYAQPSFVEGIARLLDIGGTLQEYNSSLTDHQADELALTADWRVIGEDLNNAIDAYKTAYSQVSDQLIEEAQKALIMEQYYLDQE
ncbi:hypothetical protein H6G21_05305 [Alkalinema sp. FACHB-956]|nr:hypothetical protein [Alkalinema sp. FACHB-956]